MSLTPFDDQQLAYEPPTLERAASATPTEAVLESESITAARAAHHDPYSAWRERDFRLVVLGWGTACIGQQTQSMAVAWEIYARTDRAMDLGWIGLVQALPVMLLA